MSENKDIVIKFKYKGVLKDGKPYFIMPTINDFELVNINNIQNKELYSKERLREILTKKINVTKGGIKSIRKTAKKNKNKRNKTLRKIDSI